VTGGTLTVAVERRFGAFHMKVDQSFALEGVTVLFGPSGSGKSTLLRIIAGLEPHAAGTVRSGATLWQDTGHFTPPWARGIGFVFQEPRLFPHLNVAGNLDYAESRSPKNPGQITRDKVVAALDLQALLTRRVTALSGGEKQRVAMGRALLTRPSLILMDEPLSALDLNRRSAILPLICSLPVEFGVPVIYVTHALDEAAQIADRLALMENGSISTEGTLEDVLENPQWDGLTGRFEAGVVLNAVITGHDHEFHMSSVMCEGQRLTLPLVPLERGAIIRLRIRARDVALATELPRGLSIRNVLPVQIRSIEANGQSPFAEVVLAFGDKVLRARISRISIVELGLEPGMPVYALVKSIAFDRRG
jgi:molybdate transport system ATP-binding protein